MYAYVDIDKALVDELFKSLRFQYGSSMKYKPI